MTVEPAPVIGMDDPGNVFDSEETTLQVFEHNGVWDRLCVNNP